MILQISQIDRTAEINIEPVTQLCGQNIVWKNQIRTPGNLFLYAFAIDFFQRHSKTFSY